MSEKNSLLKNIFTFGVSAATMVFLFLLAVIAARYLGPEDFGIFTFALSFVFFFDFILDPGFYHLMIRDIARDKIKVRRYMFHAFIWKSIAIPIVFILIVIVINAIHETMAIHDAVYLMAASSFLKSIKDVYRSSLLAYENFKLEAISSVIEKGGLLAIGSLALVLDYGLYGLCWAFVLVRAVDLFILHFLFSQVFTQARVPFDKDFLLGILKIGVPIGAYYVTLNIYNYIDVVMVSVMRNSEEVGWYSASYKVYEGLLIIPVIIGTVMLPRMSSYKNREDNALSILINLGWKYSFILALFITAVGAPLSEDFTILFYGESFVQSIVTLKILLYGLVFAYVVNFLQTVMISQDRQITLVRIAAFGLILNIVLNYFAINAYGYIGAAFVTIAVEGVVSVFLAYHLLKLANKNLLVTLIWILVSFLMAYLPIIFLNDMPSYVNALIWSFGFIVLLRLFKVIGDQEWRSAVDFVRNIKI